MKTTDERSGPFLNQQELARRWKLSGHTLERWRWEGRGPPFVKIYNGRILYRLSVIWEIEGEFLLDHD